VAKGIAKLSEGVGRPKDWGHVGDLAHYAEMINELYDDIAAYVE